MGQCIQSNRNRKAMIHSAGCNAIGNQILVINPGGHCEEGGEVRWKNVSFGAEQMDIYAPKIFNGAVSAKKENKLFRVQEYIPYNVLFYVLGPNGIWFTFVCK
eukprot:409489_1